MLQSLTYITEATKRLETLIRGSSMEGVSPDMDTVTVVELPQAPNRLSGFETFNIDSPAFIDALAPFKNIVNIDLEIIRTIKINYWNMGLIKESIIVPNFKEYSSSPDSYPRPSINYVSAIDTEYAYLKKYSQDINIVANWLMSLKAERGVVDYSQLPKPKLEKLTQPITRNIEQTDFNTRSYYFSDSMRKQTRSVKEMIGRYNTLYNSTESFGKIKESVTEHIDFGSVTDTFIEN